MVWDLLVNGRALMRRSWSCEYLVKKFRHSKSPYIRSSPLLDSHAYPYDRVTNVASCSESQERRWSELLQGHSRHTQKCVCSSRPVLRSWAKISSCAVQYPYFWDCVCISNPSATDPPMRWLGSCLAPVYEKAEMELASWAREM